ncbi:MAG: sulfatase [Planctomycetota bacterium]
MRTLKRTYMLLIVLLVALLHVGRAAPSAQVPARPNVLFIAIDDLRPSLGCYGDTLVTSPHIDRLAETGLQFGRAYCQQAVCGPSRTSMLTGLLPDKTRVWHNRNLFRDTHPDIVTLPQLFKKHGYHTQSLGKVFSGRTREDDPASWSMPSVLIGEGWQSYVLPENQGSGKQSPTEIADVPDDAYRDGQLAKLAIETLENLKRQARPFFLAVGFFKPHLPFNAPKAYWDRYDPAVFRAQALGARTRGAPDAAYPDHLELGGYRGVPKDERVSPEQACRLRHGYYACVSYVDAQVGKVLSALERLGLAGNTIVVLWGDHGYSLGEANHWCKDTNFELDTRVPLIMRVPGVTTRGAVTEALIEYVDIYPTLAELAGLSAPEGLDGTSLVPILRDPRRPGRELVLSQFSRPFKPSLPKVMGYSIRTDTHRYTRWIRWPGRTLMAEELYDYTSVAGVVRMGAFLVERQNLVQDPVYAETRDRLRLRMDRVLRERLAEAVMPSEPGGVAKPENKKKRNEQ